MAIGLYGPEYLQFSSGGPAREQQVFVYLPGTKTKAILYADKNKLTTAPNPQYTDARGELVFYVEEGYYDLHIPASNTTVEIAVDATPTGGSGGGPGGYEHTVITSMLLVQINHGLDWKPFPLAIDSLGERVEEDQIAYPAPGIIEVKFGVPFGPGKIYLS